MDITINTNQELEKFKIGAIQYDIVYLAVCLRTRMGELFESCLADIKTDIGTISTSIYSEIGWIRFSPIEGVGVFAMQGNTKGFANHKFNGLHIAIPFKEIVDAIQKKRKLSEMIDRQFASAEFAWSMQMEIIKSELEDEGIPFTSSILSVSMEKPAAKKNGYLGGFSIYRNENIRDLKKIKLGESFILELQVFGRTCGTAKFKAIPWKSAKQIILALKN